MIGDEFVQVIKQAAVQAVASSYPLEICYGRVSSVTRESVLNAEGKEIDILRDWRISIQQGLELGPEFFTLIGDNIRIEEGQIFIMLRIQGGTGYIILGQEGEFV